MGKRFPGKARRDARFTELWATNSKAYRRREQFFSLLFGILRGSFLRNTWRKDWPSMLNVIKTPWKGYVGRFKTRDAANWAKKFFSFTILRVLTPLMPLKLCSTKLILLGVISSPSPLTGPCTIGLASDQLPQVRIRRRTISKHCGSANSSMSLPCWHGKAVPSV